MVKRYFQLTDDVSVLGRWDLGHPRESGGRELEDPWMFREGHPVAVSGRLSVPIEVPGKALDFSLAGFSTPVVHVTVANLFQELAPDDVQLVPVDIEGRPDAYFILVATKLIRCIDDGATEEVLYWTEEDRRPEKLGQYRDVYGMRIDPAKVGDAKVFRTWGWSIALVVSEDLQRALTKKKATGVKLTPV
ncbi:imm11 family protein [Myxococcus faecalis]|uniref:imm11 family protein n=1 Tax=Myxococcus faecalis TaxID=3115646 RepID=UPI003CF3FABD